MIETVLLDMDGVLVDVRGSFRRAIDETVAALAGAPPPPGRVQALKDAGGYNNDWVLSHALLREAGVDVPYDTVVATFQARYRGSDFDGLIASEPALIRTETLAELAQTVRLALVTGRPEADAEWTLARFGWTDLIPIVVGMDEQAGREKPHPFGVLRALERLGTRAETALFAGDSVDDIGAARAAGVIPVGVVPPGHDLAGHQRTRMSAGAHVVLSTPEALPALVAALG
ncbi:MAG TPA: HAD family hydrolase [Rubricoccaceae bacterium]